MKTKSKRNLFDRRKRRVRGALRQGSGNRLRLSVYRSNCHIYAQIIDDARGCTLAAASTREKAEFESSSATGNREAAAKVGKLIAERALAVEVKQVVFDRGGYVYHGRVAALADAARAGGLDF